MIKLNQYVDPWNIVPVGSRVTCNPPPTNTDRDWLVYISRPVDWIPFCDEMTDMSGWEIGGSQPEDFDAATAHNWFNSFTKTIDGVQENVIATCDFQFFTRFKAASSVAKRLNLLDKDDRIALFQAVLYGVETFPKYPVIGNALPPPAAESW